MGLDTVEIVLAVEAEFNLKISDADAQKMQRVGYMHDFVVETLRKRDEAVDEADVWKRIVTIIVDQLGVNPEDITPSTRFVEDLKAD
jgi:acyl carrier protein